MNFLKTIGNSIYSPEFYANLSKKPFKDGIRYFFLLILLFTIIHLITLISPLLIEAPTMIGGATQNIVNCFPKELEVKITNGQLSANTQEPYFISSCEGDKSQNLAVIDTKTPFSPQKFDEYKVGAWITKDSIIFKKNDYETRTYSLTKIKDYKLNKEVLDSYQKILQPYLKFIGPILLLLSFVGIYLSYTFRLIHLLIISLLIWLLTKIFKTDLTYGQSYKIGLYAITVGLIVDLVVNLTSRWTYFHGFPFMVTIFTLTAVLVNLLLPKKAN